jgi:hypothetical protein
VNASARRRIAGLVRVLARIGAGAAIAVSCGKPAASSIGPQGGIVTSEDDGLTIVIWPGALGTFEDFEITPSEMTPDSFGQAYRVQPNLPLAVDAEIIMRGDLPDDLSKTRIGAIAPDDFTDADVMWTPLPFRAGSVDEKEGTVHSYDGELALYYAMLDDGVDSDASTGDTGTTDPTDATTTDPTGIPATTSYAQDIQPIWNQGCVTAPMCHGTAPSAGLTLSGNAYAMLVDIPATTNPDYTRVIPGDPDGSFLVQKLAGTMPGGAADGVQMPPGQMIPAAALDVVRLWIEEGCPP